MTDFMKWLYANYIKPQLDREDISDCETSLSLMDTCLDPDLRRHYERAVRFYVVHGFLLGLRTGCGLGRALTGQSR